MHFLPTPSPFQTDWAHLPMFQCDRCNLWEYKATEPKWCYLKKCANKAAAIRPFDATSVGRNLYC